MKKSRILFVLFFLLSLYFVVVYTDKFSFVIFYSLILLLLVSLFTVLAAPLFVKVTEKAEKLNVFKNESLTYNTEITNRGIFVYPEISFAFSRGDFIKYEKETGGNTPVAPGAAVSEEYSISFPFRGVYNVGIKKVYVMDFLGLFKYGFSLKNPISIVVYPEKLEDFKLTLKNELLNKASSNYDMFNDSYADVSDVRKYDPSDDYKKIHWKLTAKRNEFIVKNYQSAALNKTMLFLDTKENSLKRTEKLSFEDKMVSITASAANYCLLNRLPSRLYYGPDYTDSADITTLEELNKVFHLLAQVQFTHRKYLSRVLENMLQDSGFYNIVVFLSEIDDDLFDCFKNLFSFGHNVIIYYFYSLGLPVDRQKQDMLDVLDTMGITVNMFYSGE